MRILKIFNSGKVRTKMRLLGCGPPSPATPWRRKRETRMFTTRPPHHAFITKGSFFLTAAIIIITIGVAVAYFVEESAAADRRAREEFTKDARLNSEIFNHELRRHVSELEGLRRTIQERGNINNQIFTNIARPTMDALPAIRTILWLPRVTKAGIQRYEMETSAELGKTVQVNQRDDQGRERPLANSDTYYPVTYSVTRYASGPTPGFDLFSHRPNDDTLHSTIHSGTTIASHTTRSTLSKSNEFGFALYSPVYDRQPREIEPDQREQHLLGVIAATIRLNELVPTNLKKGLARGIQLSIYENDDKKGEQLIYESSAGGTPLPGYVENEILPVAGRSWTFRSSGTVEYLDSRHTDKAWHFAIIGFSVIASAWILVQLFSRVKAESRADSATSELRDQEQLFKYIGENLQGVIWFVSPTLDRVFYVNKAYERLTGRSRDELYKDPRAWLAAIHPDDIETVNSDLRQLESRGEHTNEFRIVRTDGRVLWIRDHAFVIRKSGEAVTGFMGISVDITDIRNDKFQLSTTRDRLEAIVNNAPLCLKILDESGMILEINPAGVAIAAAPNVDEVRNHNIINFIAPESRDSFQRALDRALRGEKCELLSHLSTFDGKTRILTSQLVPLPNSNVKRGHARVLMTSRDITDQRMAELALRESENLHRNVIRALTEGVVVQSSSARIEACNESACKILGLSQDQIVGRTSMDPRWRAIHEDGSPFPGEQHPATETLRTGRPVRDKVMGVHRPDGSLVWISINTQPIFDGDSDRPRAVVASFTDITARRAAEEIARDRQARLRKVFEFPLMGMAVTNGEREWLDVNDRLCEILGYPREELLRLTWSTITHPDDLPETLLISERMARGEIDSYVVQRRFLRKDGKTVHARAAAQCSRKSSGAIEFVVFIVEDITEQIEAQTERRRLEDRIQETQKLESLGVLAGGIAHDFNNILTGILGNAGLARMKLESGSESAEFIDRIEVASQRAAELCRQLLAYAGKSQFIILNINLSQLVRECIQLLNTSIHKNTNLVLDLRDEIPEVRGDSTQLRQVVMNLVMNASEAIGEGAGKITIRTSSRKVDAAFLASSQFTQGLAPGEHVALEVTDTGMGMSEATLARIFDPFFTTKFTGRGLGLSAVLGIVRSHGGAIRVESKPGEGTTFVMVLPRAVRPSEAGVPAAIPAQFLTLERDTTILVVDDERPVRDVFISTLASTGAVVLEAIDGDDAMRVFNKYRNNIQIAFIDLTMPGLDGISVARRIRTAAPNVRIILMSGYHQSEVAPRIAGVNIAGFLQKPFHPAEILRYAGLPAPQN